MKVILREPLRGLGRTGDSVEVADGYARNYLVPKGIAQVATPALMREWESRRQKIEKGLEAQRESAEASRTKIESGVVKMKVRAGDEGKLFGSVTNVDIADHLKAELDIEVDRRKIELSEPIKHVGEFKVVIALHPDVEAELTLDVASDREDSAN